MCLTGCKSADDPKEGDGGSGSAAPVAACTIECPPMEIEINDTPVATDDLVQIKCDVVAHRPVVNCRIRATSACPADSTVVLTNPDGRLRFTGPADRTATVTVPGNGSWVSFQVSGETGSAAIGDAVIEAHCHTATGPLKASKPMTVFWFDLAHVNLTPGGVYQVDALGMFTSSAPPGIAMAVQARIRPAGVNCAAPQVARIKIGILQNALAGVRKKVVFGPPAIVWNAGVARNTPVTVPAAWAQIKNRPAQANDSATTVAPLYDQPGKADTFDPNSLQAPVGCPGSAPATSSDTPESPTTGMPVVSQPATDAGGTVVGTVTYPFRSVQISTNFVTWTVAFDTTSNDVCLLRERTWAINVVSTDRPARRTTTAAADSAPATAPVFAPPFSNAVINLAANVTLGPDPAAGTTILRHP